MVLYECRLVFHKNNNKSTDEDILFNSKEFPLITPGCFLEIFHSENEKHHLVRITSINSNYLSKDTISFDQHLANSLRLTQNKILKFQIIEENLITLDIVDIIIRDQYLSRSDTYRFCNSIRNSVLQVNKKLEFGPCRGTVGEMWCLGQRNHSGYFGRNSRVAFRSATAVVHIFIQMSTEMWEFDYFGQLYFDKAINFISDLFNKWNDNNCGHDVTIVLFSRLFYKKSNRVKILENGRNIKMDCNGRYYEDFYIVVVQNERYVIGEWRKVIKTLKFRFNNYKFELEEFFRQNLDIDFESESYLSTSEDSNFLETLNMTLNLYENYYIDRNFERTGKICVVITAGSGVYNVDRVQTNLTKQRICDLGVGMDLVCIGEQPLHTVPLFIFRQKMISNTKDNHYYIPYWINHSFYRSANELQAIQMGKFIPRIKVSIEKISDFKSLHKDKNDESKPELITNSWNHTRKLSKHELICRENGSSSIFINGLIGSDNSKDDSYLQSTKSLNKKLDIIKPLFNPFVPNRFNVRTTSNSRRWSHVFPIDKTNKPIQLHHQLAINNPSLYGIENKRTKSMVEAWKSYYQLYNSVNTKPNETLELSSSPIQRDTITPAKLAYHDCETPEFLIEKPGFSIFSDKGSEDSFGISPLPSSFQGGGSQKSFPQASSSRGSINRKPLALFTDGDQKWNWDQVKEEENPINHMGVDWKSLTLPAMLPITSDYFPSPKALEDDFMESNYQLMAHGLDINGESNSVQSNRKPLGVNEIFQELIYQRLNQGFQLITNPPTINNDSGTAQKERKSFSKMKNTYALYRFGLGDIFHCIQQKQDVINVTQYSPRHSTILEDITYEYCLKMPDSKDFMMSKTRFSTQMLEKFNWNYQDHYILNYGGYSSAENSCRYKLVPSLKYWRSRFYLLPMHPATRTIIEYDKSYHGHCDIYDDKSVVEQNALIEEFFRFLEVINKIKRAPTSKKSTIQSACLVSNVANSMSPIRPAIHHRHSATHEPNFYNQLCSELSSNSSNPVTPIEKFPRQFTFDSIDNTKSVSGNELTDRLTDSTPISKVLEEMTNFQTGLTFLPSSDFPNEYTFTSYEAVNWCIRKMDKVHDVKSAVQYLQKLMNRKCIFHVSECPSHKFIYGFVLYCLNNSNKFHNNSLLDVRNISNSTSGSSSLTNLVTEESENSLKSKKHNMEWVEVYLSSIEIDGQPERDWVSDYLEKTSSTRFHLQGESHRPIDSCQNVIFFMKNIPDRYFTNCFSYDNVKDFIGNSQDSDMICEKNGVLYKKAVLDIDNDRIDRPEWGVFQYQANYHPTMAFEMMFQWLVATGGKLAEKISQWSRKTSALQFVPVPCDPFALPSSINSDPLRGPVFVPVNISCLIDSDVADSSNQSMCDVIDRVFKDFPNSERLHRFLLFQEVILKRFGFIRESCVNYSPKQQVKYLENDRYHQMSEFTNTLYQPTSGVSTLWSYIHYSGAMFAMIPSYIKIEDFSYQLDMPVKMDDIHIGLSSPNIRHLNTDEDSEEWETSNIGFLWSWNKMLTRKWTTSGLIVDEQFQDRMLLDFREFCANKDDRLKQFFNDAKVTAAKYFNDV